MDFQKPLASPIYTYNAEIRTHSFFKMLASLIFFPVGLYHLAHSLAGRIIVPAATPALMDYSSNHADESRKKINSNTEWQIKRISFQVEGYTIDALIIGKASTLTNRLLGILVKIGGWNISAIESSRGLEAPEIIIQTADVPSYRDISNNPKRIKHDGVIPAKASLTYALLEKDLLPPFGPKYFMGVPEDHNTDLFSLEHLVRKIKDFLDSPLKAV